MFVATLFRFRFLLLPWLFLFGLLQIALLVAIVAAVLELPTDVKLLSAGLVAVEAFFVFPWWFAVIHLFAVISHQEMISTSTAPSWSYSIGIGSSEDTKMSEL